MLALAVPGVYTRGKDEVPSHERQLTNMKEAFKDGPHSFGFWPLDLTWDKEGKMIGHWNLAKENLRLKATLLYGQRIFECARRIKAIPDNELLKEGDKKRNEGPNHMWHEHARHYENNYGSEAFSSEINNKRAGILSPFKLTNALIKMAQHDNAYRCLTDSNLKRQSAVFTGKAPEKGMLSRGKGPSLNSKLAAIDSKLMLWAFYRPVPLNDIYIALMWRDLEVRVWQV